MTLILDPRCAANAAPAAPRPASRLPYGGASIQSNASGSVLVMASATMADLCWLRGVLDAEIARLEGGG
jgi:hypothetical protein